MDSPTTAQADAFAAIHSQMTAYFAAEKSESVLFLAAGVAAVIASVVLWRTGSAYRGMGVPLIAIGLIQIFVGGAVFFRTDSQLAGLAETARRAPATYRAAEIPRMEKVMANFTVYKTVEIALLLGGIGLTFAFRGRDFIHAAGIGLIVQSSLMLTLDLFAERRGDHYLAQVRALPAQPLPDAV